MLKIIQDEFQSHLETIQKVINHMEPLLAEASQLVVETLRNGNKILICGIQISL